MYFILHKHYINYFICRGLEYITPVVTKFIVSNETLAIMNALPIYGTVDISNAGIILNNLRVQTTNCDVTGRFRGNYSICIESASSPPSVIPNITQIINSTTMPVTNSTSNNSTLWIIIGVSVLLLLSLVAYWVNRQKYSRQITSRSLQSTMLTAKDGTVESPLYLLDLAVLEPFQLNA